MYKGNVYVDGKPVCDNGWGAEEAKVVCRYLGYTGLAIPEKKSTYGNAETGEQFGLGSVNCKGQEKNLLECGARTKTGCGRGEVAGVTCFTSSVTYTGVEQCGENIVVGERDWVQSRLAPRRESGDLRLFLLLQLSGDIDLRGGSGDLGDNVYKGNVYVDGKPVCDDCWGAEEAKVVCRYLGYTGLAIPEKESAYGNAEPREQFGLSYVNCKGQEKNLLECLARRITRCSRGHVAGVTCFTFSGGNLGVEIPNFIGFSFS